MSFKTRPGELHVLPHTSLHVWLHFTSKPVSW